MRWITEALAPPDETVIAAHPPSTAMPEPAPMSTLRLRLYGEPAVLLADGQSVALERRAAALLAVVALEPGISRLRLASLLWPDSSDPRRNLRQQLLRFRQAFDRDLLVGDEALQLAPGITADVDAPQGDAPLLGTHSFDDCEELSTWLSRRRLQQREDRLAAARQRLDQSEAAGELEAALHAAHALLALDDQQESHHRALMRLHYLRGDNAAGLAAHRRVSEMLSRDFGTQPSAATEQLAQALKAQRQHTPGAVAAPGLAAHPGPLAVTLLRPPVMAGRGPELAAVRGHWAQGRAVLLEGEAGLGKSRLMAELLATTASAATVDPAVRSMATSSEPKPMVISAAGRPGDAGAPYATLARLLRPLLIESLDDLAADVREALAHIAPALPQAAATAGRPTPAALLTAPAAGTQAPGALRPGALAHAVSELLLRRGRHLIALDDLHFADEATLDLIAGLAANAEPPRRWLFAARPAELPAAALALREGLTELQRLGVVALAALDAPAIASLITAVNIPGLHATDLAAPLWRHTGGNPLFVLETLKQGLADGSLARGELPRPQGVGWLIERRLQRLTEPALALARVAAIAGVDFSIELAEAAIGARAVQLASAWAELQTAQVLRDEAFAHDLVCDAVLRGVPPVVARRVHTQCAQWLAAQGIEPARVAWHWLRGGVPAQAGQAFMAAAARAARAARTQDEASLCTQAAQAFEAAGLADERFDALCRRGVALVASNFGEQALQELRDLVARAANDAQRLRALRVLVNLLSERSESAEAVQAGLAGMSLSRRLGDHEATLRLACHVASAQCRLGLAEDALQLLLPLRPWVEAQADPELRMLWRGDWAATLGHLGRLREAVAAYDDARAAARQTGRPDAEGRLMMNCAVTLRQGGQLDRALALSRQGRALSAGDPTDASHLLIANLVVARDEAETGCYGSALAALEDTLPQFVATGASFWAQACRLVLVPVWLHLGQPARALALLRDEPEGLPAWLRADRLLLQCELALALGQPLPAGAVQAALALADTDPQRGPGLHVRSLAFLPPQQALAGGTEMASAWGRHERLGALAALQVQVCRAQLQLGDERAAGSAAQALVALMNEGCAPQSVYRAEAWWLAHRALRAAGEAAQAQRALDEGARWVTQTALPQVPPAFIDSFLHRNPVNRDLLAAARSAANRGD